MYHILGGVVCLLSLVCVLALGYFQYKMYYILGGVVCLLSLVCALSLGYFDKRADRILKRKKITSGKFIFV